MTDRCTAVWTDSEFLNRWVYVEQMKLVPGECTLRTAVSHSKDIPFHSPLQSQDRKMDVTETGAPGTSTAPSVV